MRSMMLTALVLVGACGFILPDDDRPPTPRSYPDVQMYLSAFTPDGNATRYMLAVGDTGYVHPNASYGCGAPFGYPNLRCDINDGEIVVRIADEQVATFLRIPDYSGRAFVAKAPGTIQISASVSGLVSTAERVVVDVVAVVPPVDSIRVRRFAWDTSSNVVVDAAGNLLSATLPGGGGSVSTRVIAFRGGDSTVYLPVTTESSDPAVAEMTIFCSFGTRGCHSSKHTRVKGVAPGAATVTVRGRNQQYSFLVTVR